MDKETKKEFQSLSRMVKKGFDNVDSEFKRAYKLIHYGFKENMKEHQRMEMKIDKTYNLIDSYVKGQEDFKEEFTILKAEVAKIKEIIKKKLGIEIRAL